ncbi:TPA: hypothetical protein ACH2LV_003380 [Vibrio cholerae]|nr:hypothetical protein VCSRO161_3597 [Vibrio cholerae]GIB53272.1 hypothetical protein VCSRO187_3511 [Vibrio cholerae]
MTTLDTIAKRIWHHAPHDNFTDEAEFRAMFDQVTERAWQAVNQASFQNKEAFALLYWTDFQERNLRRQPKKTQRKKSKAKKGKATKQG